MTPARAVLFDCDGVLVDSESLAWAAWGEVLAGYGVELTAADIEAGTGRRVDEVLDLFTSRGWVGDPEVFLQQVREATEGRFRAALRPFPDARAAMLRAAEAGLMVAVASSSQRWRLDLALTVTGLVQLADVTVAGDEVAEGKPRPDLFLAAAARLGVAPSGCVVVEDSPSGVTAGLAAGMRVVAVDRGMFPPRLLAPAHRVVSSLDELGWQAVPHPDRAE